MGGKNPSPFSSVRTELPVVHGVIATAASSFWNFAVRTGAGAAGTWRKVPLAHAVTSRARAARVRRRQFKARPYNHTRPHKASVRVKAVVISRTQSDVCCDVIFRGRALDPIVLTRAPSRLTECEQPFPASFGPATRGRMIRCTAGCGGSLCHANRTSNLSAPAGEHARRVGIFGNFRSRPDNPAALAMRSRFMPTPHP